MAFSKSLAAGKVGKPRGQGVRGQRQGGQGERQQHRFAEHRGGLGEGTGGGARGVAGRPRDAVGSAMIYAGCRWGASGRAGASGTATCQIIWRDSNVYGLNLNAGSPYAVLVQVGLQCRSPAVHPSPVSRQ